MGEKSNINFELGPGTIYFSDGDGFGLKVEHIECVEDLETEGDVPKYITKIINADEPVEFTGTINPSFNGLVMLMGFWPAVKWKIRTLWRMLRTPIEEDDE